MLMTQPPLLLLARGRRCLASWRASSSKALTASSPSTDRLQLMLRGPAPQLRRLAPLLTSNRRAPKRPTRRFLPPPPLLPSPLGQRGLLTH